jgi:hypothetical protein
MNKEWYQHNNLAVKLRDALENVINGQGLPYVFADLEKGSCVVEVIYNGETCTFYNKNPPPKASKVVTPLPSFLNDDNKEAIGKSIVEDNEVYNTEFTPPVEDKPKRTRKTKTSEDAV